MIWMKVLKQYSLISTTLVAIVFLQACAFTPVKKQIADHEVDDHYQKANIAYQNKEYKKAVSLLEPLAKRGYAKAQYTLSYMYYHGQGVDQDLEVALRWTQLAASKGYPKAIQALQRQYKAQQDVKALQEKVEAESVLEQSSLVKDPVLQSNKSTDADAVVSSVVPLPNSDEPIIESSEMPEDVKPEPTPTLTPTPKPKPSIESTKHQQWLLEQPSGNYTLQLIAGDNEEKIKLFILDHDLYGRAVYFRSSKRKTPWFSVVYGSFSSVSETEQIINQLPPKLRTPKPWVRDFATIRKLMAFD